MGLNMDALRQKYDAVQKAKASRNYQGFWTPKVGMNSIRVLPPWDPKKGLYFRDTAYHYSIGEENRAFVCLRAEGQSCPICELRQALYNSNIEEMKELASSLSPTTRIFMNIIDRNAPQQGVQVSRFGVTIHEGIASYILDPQWGDLTDPQGGRDITIERRGQGIDTEYFVRATPAVTPISMDPNGVNAVLADLKDLDQIVKVREPQELIDAVAPIQEILNKALGMVGGQVGPASPPPATPVKSAPVAAPQPAAPKPAPVQPQPAPVAPAPVAQPVQPAPTTPAPAPVAPAPAPAPATPAGPVAPPVDTEAPKPVTPKGSKMSIPEQYQKCFGLQYDPQKDDCMLCAYEAFCMQSMNKTK